MTETVVAAAISYPGLGNQVIATLPAPNRHHHIIHAWKQTTGQRTGGDALQGFLTSAGRFVDRDEARRIAIEAKQIAPWATHHATALFSEDLW